MNFFGDIQSLFGNTAIFVNATEWSPEANKSILSLCSIRLDKVSDLICENVFYGIHDEFPELSKRFYKYSICFRLFPRLYSLLLKF